MKKLFPFYLSILLIATLSSPVFAQKTAFTVEDVINVKSLSSQNLSHDGKYLAGMITDARSRFGTDHFRFRDPSYVNVSPGEFVIIDTDSGEQLKPYRNSARITSMSWSPNSKEIAYYEQKGDRLTLMVYNVDRNRVREIKVSGNPILDGSTPIWSPDGSSLIIQVKEGGWLERAMALYNEATKGPIVVYDGSKPFLKWDEIGAVNSLSSVVKVNISNGRVEKLLGESNYSAVDISQDGNYLRFTESFPEKTSYERNQGTKYQNAFLHLNIKDSVTVTYPKNNQRRNYSWTESNSTFAWTDSGNVYIQTLGDTTSTNLTKGKAYSDEKKKKEVRFSIQQWSPSEEKMLLSSDKGWWILDAGNGDLNMIYEFPENREESPNLSVQYWNEDENQLILSSSDKERWERGFVSYDIDSKEFETLRLDSNLYNGLRISDDGSKVLLNYSDGNLPSDVMIADLSFSEMKPLTDLNSWISNKKITKSELISYRDVDGKELKGILYYPVDYEEGKKYPLVIEVYESFFNNGYNPRMNLIANQGYFGLRPSVELEQGYPGEAWVKGITSAVNKLVDEGKVDNDKVGVQGTSYGGYATSLLITQTDRFAASINVSGKVNIISFLGDSPKIGTRNYSAAEVGQDRIGESLWDAPLKYFSTTAVLYADRVETPHLLITGEGDWNVPGTNSREFYYALRRLGKDVKWVNYMNGGHGAGWASDEKDYYHMYELIFDYYAEHFADKENEENETEE